MGQGTKRRYLLVDGNNLLMRSIYGTMHADMTANGIKTGAIVAFINTLAKYIAHENATHVGVAWDTGAPRVRNTVDSQYKENRQVGPVAEERNRIRPIVKEFCRLAQIVQVEQDGYEADDIIAAWWGNIQTPRASFDFTRHPGVAQCASVEPISLEQCQCNEDHLSAHATRRAGGNITVWHTIPDERVSITILSSDKDFLQLLGENPYGIATEQLRLSSFGTDTDRWTAIRVAEQFSCQPENLPYLMAIMGDLSDNVRGIKGIGPKRAAKMLEKSGWNFPAAVNANILTEEDRERVFCNLQLVNLREVDVPLSAWEDTDLVFAPPTWQHGDLYAELLNFCQHWQLNSVVERLPTALWFGKPLPGKHFEVPTHLHPGAAPLP